nr:MAG TPA: minor tail protein Z [Caudoviricetes sp.]
MALRSGMISFEADATQLERIHLRLMHMNKQAPSVLKKALNATARDAKTDLAKKAKETYAVRAPRFKKAIGQKNATNSKLVATLKITGKSTALADFTHKAHAGGASARAKLYKGGTLKDLSLNDKLKAFVVKFKSGHEAVVRRDPPNRYTRGLAERIRTGGDRTKLKEFYSPSVPRMVGNEAKVYGIVKPKIQENLQRHVDQEIQKIFGGRR